MTNMETGVEKRVENEIREVFEYIQQVLSKSSGREVKIDVETEFDEKGQLIAVTGTFYFETFDWSLWGIVRDVFGGKGYRQVNWYVYPHNENMVKVEIAVLLV